MKYENIMVAMLPRVPQEMTITGVTDSEKGDVTLRF